MQVNRFCSVNLGHTAQFLAAVAEKRPGHSIGSRCLQCYRARVAVSQFRVVLLTTKAVLISIGLLCRLFPGIFFNFIQEAR